MANRIIFSPWIGGNKGNHYTVSIADRTIAFDCLGLNYEGQIINRIILNAENLASEFAEKYLFANSLLTFEVEEAEIETNNTLALKTFRMVGFYNGEISFQISKVIEKGNNLMIEIEDELFNSDSKTLFLPKYHNKVKKIILPYKNDWSSIVGKKFTIKGINGGKCYFKDDNLILNEFDNLFEGEKAKKPEEEESYPVTFPQKHESIEETKETIEDYQEILTKYKEELEKNKELLEENKLLFDDNNILEEQLKQAEQKIKELEKCSSDTENRLRELYNLAKNGSSSLPPNQNNSNLKSQLAKLQQEQQEWKNKLSKEKEKNKDLEAQIKQYKNQSISPKTFWETARKPLLIGGSIAGGLFIIFIIYKKFIARYFN